jgi:endonuclease/exonuclease/phosphatase family metal-dependent hydrolase
MASMKGAGMTAVRIATFNLENVDETPAGRRPTLAERIALVRPQIVRLRADIVCFQEVSGQERPGQPRALLALAELLAGTSLQGASVISTQPAGGGVYDERNVVVVTRLPVTAHRQLHNDLVKEPLYTRITAVSPDGAPVPVGPSGPSCMSRSTSALPACCTSSTCT